MTDEVDTKKMVIVAPQETPQTGNLTGSAGKENPTTGLQKTFNLQKGVPNDALDIFAAAKCRESLARLGTAVTDFPMFVEGGSKHHTASIDHLFGKGGEHTARTAGTTHLSVGVHCGESLQGLMFGIGMQFGAYLFAQTAVDAQ